MARKARISSSTGIYHVLVRAISDISLFVDDEDTSIYLDILKSLQDKGYCTIYAYALFDTHIHLLIQDTSLPIGEGQGEAVGSIMKRLASTYAYYYNGKYDHYGPIYLDRFKSEPIEDFHTFVSCQNFITTQSTATKGILTESIPFPADSGTAIDKSLISSSCIESASLITNHSSFIDFAPRATRITDSRLRNFLAERYNFTTPDEFLQRQDKDKTLAVTSSMTFGANVLQISRLTGLTRKVVTRMTQRGSLCK